VLQTIVFHFFFSAPALAASLAELRGTEAFQLAECAFLRKKFPGIRCGYEPPGSQCAAPERDDRLEDLTETWIDPSALFYDLDRLPLQGKVTTDLWSDDYWKTRWGGVSYRYSKAVEYGSYSEAIEAYLQPERWLRLVSRRPTPVVNRRLARWSPAEKYDLSLFDTEFTLTNQQKALGLDFLDDEGDVEEWMGICHGWSAAAIMVPRPKRTVETTGPRGTKVTWYPNDIKAMASLLWAEGESTQNFVGSKCHGTKPPVMKNGSLRDESCFDTNPATFHLALGNMLGRNGLSFVMDSTFDYEVWNQPLHSYTFEYFHPLRPDLRSRSWRDVAVPYDGAFRKADRFQSPLTRGEKRPGGRRDDSRIRFIVGVKTTVFYLAEAEPPDHSDTAFRDFMDEATYTYDLELSEANGTLAATGGEWHDNAHPDFLWVPRRGAFATTEFDDTPFPFSGEGRLSLRATEHAREASREGVPLASVVSKLVEKATAP
jgi:hypothetical protein